MIAAERDAALLQRVAMMISWFGYVITGELMVKLHEFKEEDLDLDLFPPWRQIEAHWQSITEAQRDGLLEMASRAIYGDDDGNQA